MKSYKEEKSNEVLVGQTKKGSRGSCSPTSLGWLVSSFVSTLETSTWGGMDIPSFTV